MRALFLEMVLPLWALIGALPPLELHTGKRPLTGDIEPMSQRSSTRIAVADGSFNGIASRKQSDGKRKIKNSIRSSSETWIEWKNLCPINKYPGILPHNPPLLIHQSIR